MKQKRLSTTKDTKGHEKGNDNLIDLISCNFMLFVVRNDVLGLRMKQKRLSTTKDTKGHEKGNDNLIDLISCNFMLFVVRNDVLGFKE